MRKRIGRIREGVERSESWGRGVGEGEEGVEGRMGGSVERMEGVKGGRGRTKSAGLAGDLVSSFLFMYFFLFLQDCLCLFVWLA